VGFELKQGSKPSENVAVCCQAGDLNQPPTSLPHLVQSRGPSIA